MSSDQGFFYRIPNWVDRFENNRTRELKYLEWVAFHNPMLYNGGQAYAELMDHEEGPLHFAVWVGCVFLASRSQERGTLVRSSAAQGCDPMSQASVALTCRIPALKCGIALERLCELGWLEKVSLTQHRLYVGAGKSQEGAGKSQEGAGKSQEGAASRAREHGTERNGITTTPPTPPLSREGDHKTFTKRPTRAQQRETEALETMDLLQRKL